MPQPWSVRITEILHESHLRYVKSYYNIKISVEIYLTLLMLESNKESYTKGHSPGEHGKGLTHFHWSFSEHEESIYWNALWCLGNIHDFPIILSPSSSVTDSSIHKSD